MSADVQLNLLGSFKTGIFDESAAEISAFDPDSERLFVTNSDSDTIDVLSLADPTTPAFLFSIDVTAFGGGVNSVSTSNGVIAAAIENEDDAGAGQVVFFDVEGNVLNQVTVGILPDMVTFTPDGSKVLVANEAEPTDTVDPEGSISIIDLSNGVANLTQTDVQTADFTAFNGRENDLRGDGVIIAPGTTVAQDVEPEFIAVSADGQTAFVSLQENNAFGVVDLETATVVDILPLGVNDFSKGLPELSQFEVTGLPQIGTTPDGVDISLGGLSGLWFDGVNPDTGNLQFLAINDRGPVGPNNQLATDGVTTGRQFLVPDLQVSVLTLELDQTSGEVSIVDTLGLTREVNGQSVPITGLPNIPGFNETPLDAGLNPIDPDPFGSDSEGILRDPEGNLWTVDEQGPSIYVYAPDGVLINRFVPEGYAALAGEAPGTFGSETLPADYLTRRNNRGFEAIALDTETGILYAFIQTPLANPDSATSNASQVIRILGIDPATGEPVAEYVYLLQDPDLGGDTSATEVDRIGDAVFAGNGKFFVIERDGEFNTSAQHLLFEIDLTGATNVLDTPALPAGTTLEAQSPDDLAALGIQPVNKVRVANLPSLGYLPSAQPEGLALLPDGSLAVLNDNDYTLEPGQEAVSLGLLEFTGSNGLDPSDRDGGINIDNFPVFGLRQPDAIAAFSANGETFYITANEGDGRDDVNVEDIALDPTAFPDAATLQLEENLGRLEVSPDLGDLDGDGDFDQLFAFGSRGFSIFDSLGNLVFDSGDALEQITAAAFPADFNSDNDENGSFDSRSNDAGPEPEGLTTGVVNGETYAFIGLERIGGIVVYNISDPSSPEFVQYLNNRDFSGNAEAGTAGDLGPEGLVFLTAEDSPTGRPSLIVTNEVSGSTTVYDFGETTLGTTAGDELVGEASNDALQADAGDDTVAGGLGDDIIYGGDDDDVLRGDANRRSTQDGTDGGDDIIFGGAGNDRIGGKTGNDTLFGDQGDDTLWGDDGDDLINGGAGNDTLIGDNFSAGTGSDTFVLTVGEGTDTIVDFEVGIDTLRVVGVSSLAELTLSGSTLGFAGEVLADLQGIDTTTLTTTDFEFVA